MKCASANIFSIHILIISFFPPALLQVNFGLQMNALVAALFLLSSTVVVAKTVADGAQAARFRRLARASAGAGS